MRRLGCRQASRLSPAYPGITDKQVIGEFDQGLQRLYVDFCKEKGMEWSQIVATLTGREFYRPRAIMRAFESAEPCVLLVDELDKVPDEIEAMLLEAFSDWQLSLPELGTVKAKTIPMQRDSRVYNDDYGRDGRVGAGWIRIAQNPPFYMHNTSTNQAYDSSGFGEHLTRMSGID